MLAIVDADTDHLAKKNSSNPDLILTHTRDSEGMLLQSDALRSVLIEFDLQGVFGSSPELVVMEAVAPLGIMRFIIHRERWNVRISQLDFSEFINPVTVKCDPRKMCTHVADLTITNGVTAERYQRELSTFMQKGIDPYKVSRGHDATTLLAWIIPIATKRKRKDGAIVSAQLVESYLRTAYPLEAFVKCELYGHIAHWESRNVPYRVLKK